jgi:hypothetical protein
MKRRRLLAEAVLDYRRSLAADGRLGKRLRSYLVSRLKRHIAHDAMRFFGDGPKVARLLGISTRTLARLLGAADAPSRRTRKRGR